MAQPWPTDPGWDVEESSISPAPGRIISDLAISGQTGQMITRGQVLVFDLVYPLLNLTQYNTFKPFESTFLGEDITLTYDGTLHTLILIEEPFFRHQKGAVYFGRALLRDKAAM